MCKEQQDLFEKKNEERIIEIELERLRDFRGHPFKINDDNQMKGLKESIEKYGILTPLIVRPVPEGFYEIISGHRRRFVAKMLGYRKVPVIIRVMEDDEAIIAMIDANNQREDIKTSEKAFAFRMKYDVMKRKAGRRKKGYGGQPGYDNTGKKTVEVLGQQSGISPKQVQRYLRITELVPELIDKVDNGGISFNPAVEISYLDKNGQYMLLDIMSYTQTKPSLSQAQRIRKLWQEGNLNRRMMKQILSEDKNRYYGKVMFEGDEVRKYFPPGYSAEMIKKEILEMVRRWKRKERVRNEKRRREEICVK